MRRFDYKAAKAAGISDEDIAKYLDEKNAAGDSMYIAKEDLAPDPQPIAGRTPSIDSMANYDPLGSRLPSFLPTAGGFAGGWLGRMAGAPIAGVGAIPGGIAGAGIGGGIGEGARELLQGEPLSPSKIGLQATSQGVQQGIGEGIAAGASRMAGPLMKKALGVVPSLAKRFNMTPEQISAIVLGKRFPITAAGEKAAERAGGAVYAARSADIAKVPGTVGAKRIAQTAIMDAEKFAGRRLTPFERQDMIARVEDEANAILTRATHGVIPKGGMGATRYSAREVEQIKEAAALEAKPSYRAAQRLEGTAAAPGFSKQIATGARRTLDKSPMLPGIGAQNIELRNMKAARLAIADALSKGSGDWTPLHIGPLSVGLKVPRDKVGQIALVLTSKNFQRIARYAPRAAAEALHQALYSAEPDATGQ